MYLPEQPTEKCGPGTEATVDGKTVTEHVTDRLADQNKVAGWVTRALRWLHNLAGSKME